MNASKLLVILLVLLLPFRGLAHGYWIELEGDHQPGKPVTIKLIFGEYLLAEKLSGDKLDRMKDIRVFVILPGGEKTTVEMKQLPDCWQGQFTPATEGLYTITGINDEREVQDWTKHGLGITRPVQYLKAEYEVGKVKQDAAVSMPVDIIIEKQNGNIYALYLSGNKKPLDTCIVTIVSPAGEEEEIRTNGEGKATFSVKGNGLYLVGVEWIDKTPGVFKGKEYKTVRHKLDYSLYH